LFNEDAVVATLVGALSDPRFPLSPRVGCAWTMVIVLDGQPTFSDPFAESPVTPEQDADSWHERRVAPKSSCLGVSGLLRRYLIPVRVLIARRRELVNRRISQRLLMPSERVPQPLGVPAHGECEDNEDGYPYRRGQSSDRACQQEELLHHAMTLPQGRSESPSLGAWADQGAKPVPVEDAAAAGRSGPERSVPAIVYKTATSGTESSAPSGPPSMNPAVRMSTVASALASLARYPVRFEGAPRARTPNGWLNASMSFAKS
jgi:hypothetical protein